MNVYILYRKIYIRDGDHELTERVYTSMDLTKIFTMDNYKELKNYKDRYEEETGCTEEDYYFILTSELDKLNVKGVDDGRLFWDPEKRSNDTFQGSLEEFKKRCEVDDISQRSEESENLRI